MEETIIPIIGMVYVFFIFVYVNKRNEAAIRATNRRLRFGLIMSSFIMCIPVWLFFGLEMNVERIAKYFSVNTQYISIGIMISVFLIIGPITFTGVYEPINRRRHQDEKNYRKNNAKDWKYYILKKPATSLRMSLKLPPVSKWSPLNPETLRRYHIKMLDAPPTHIQYILLFLTYLITTAGLWLCDYINGVSDAIYVNLLVMPFIIMVVLMSEIIFGITGFIERLINRTSNELLKYFLFNLFYVLFVNRVINVMG